MVSLLFILFGIWPCISQVVMLLHCGILSVVFCPKTWIPGVRWLNVSLQLLYFFKQVSVLHGCKVSHLEQNQMQVYFLSLTLWWRKARWAPDFETWESSSLEICSTPETSHSASFLQKEWLPGGCIFQWYLQLDGDCMAQVIRSLTTYLSPSVL